jgi:hypothetical protein
MYIKSEIGKLSRYGEDAVQAFRTAVDNGQARLGMQILVDIIEKFSEKFDELDALIDEKMNSITPEKVIETKEEPVQIKAEEVKVEDKEAAPAPVQPKVKPVQKEVQTDK